MTIRKLQLMKKTLFLFLCFITVSLNSFSQNNDTNTGKEFYASFGRNSTYTALVVGGDTVQLTLRVTTSTPANVEFKFAANAALDTTLSIGANKVHDFVLSHARALAVYAASYNSQTPSANLKSVYVKSSTPINLIAISATWANIEATLVSPMEKIGKEYHHSGMGANGSSNYDGFVLIATEDNTTINITNNTSTFTATINKGMVYPYYQSNTVLYPGVKVTANKPIYYFYNNTCGQIAIPGGTSLNNFMFEQHPPIEQWGYRFIVPTNENNGGMVRILAKEFPTNVEVKYGNGQSYTIPLTSGVKYHDLKITTENMQLRNEKSVFLSSDKQISVVTYNQAYYSTSFSQPGTAWLPPLGQRLTSVLVSPLDIRYKNATQKFDHYVMIIAPHGSEHKTTISINGGAPTAFHDSIWTKNGATNVGGSGYSFGRYHLGFSQNIPPPPLYLDLTAQIENPDGLIVLAYGQGNYTSYFYSLGGAARDLSKKYSISGTVTGLPNNEGIPVRYTINGGTQEVVTTAGGAYLIDSIPASSNVIITASAQTNYIGTVSEYPSTSMVTSDITGKNITYKYSNNVSIEYTKVFLCHTESEIDILSMMGYEGSCNNVTFKMIDDPKYAHPISGLNGNGYLPYKLKTTDFEGKDNMLFSIQCGQSAKIDTVQLLFM